LFSKLFLLLLVWLNINGLIANISVHIERGFDKCAIFNLSKKKILTSLYTLGITDKEIY
jgi:hypothetical protein